MVVAGYFFIGCGFLNIFGNAIFIFMMDSFTNIGWTENGIYKSVRIDPGYLFLMALFKIIVGGIFLIKQGKMSVKIFGKIVKEYKDAERGETNGITMERKSQQMKTHKKQIKKITIATFGLGVLAMLIAKEMMVDIADQYIEGEFKLMNRTNNTSFTFNVDPSTLWAYSDKQRKEYGDYGDIFSFDGQPFPDVIDPQPVVAVDPIWIEEKNNTILNMTVPIEQNPFDFVFNKTWKTVHPFNITKEADNTIEKKHHHKHHMRHHKKHAQPEDDGMFGIPTDQNGWGDESYKMYGDGFDFDMSNMTEPEAKNVARFWISVLMIVCFAWNGVCYLWIQVWYIFAINKVLKPQKKLEKHFMGPEVAALPNTMDTIQTVNVEQQQVPPNYICYQPAQGTGHIQGNIGNGLN